MKKRLLPCLAVLFLLLTLLCCWLLKKKVSPIVIIIGMFAVEEKEVSVCMGRDKVRDHMSTGAEYITGADSSCLMHMQGVIDRERLPIKTLHIVEILTARQ